MQNYDLVKLSLFGDYVWFKEIRTELVVNFTCQLDCVMGS